MLRPRNFIITMGIALLLTVVGCHLERIGYLGKERKKTIRALSPFFNPPRNITLVFIDITYSDSTKSWSTDSVRSQFIKAFNDGFTSMHDVFAGFVLHGGTRDIQPFWSNRMLTDPMEISVEDSAAVIKAGTEKIKGLKALDNTIRALQLRTPGRQDSALTIFTDVFGALQQAAIYFRHYQMSPADRKQIFFLSDGKENAGSIKLNHITSRKAANDLVEPALMQLHSQTDIKNELQNTIVYFLTPNHLLYYNEERNYRRLFWEKLLVDGLKCSNVNYQ